MRQVRVRDRHDRADWEDLPEDLGLECFRNGYDELVENPAEEVISEIGLVLVITLGAVFAINVALAALHVG
jgi:hypothetical protein